MKLSVMIAIAVWSQSNINATQQADFATSIRQGHAEYRNGHYSASRKLLLDALAQLSPSDDLRRAATLGDLGDAYASEEEYSKAERAYSDALSIYKQRGDQNQSALMLHNVAMLYSLLGRSDDAFRILNQAQQLVKSASKPEPTITALLLNGLGILSYRRGQNGKAEKYFNQVLQMVETSAIQFDTARVLNNLASVYLAQRKLKLAEETFNRALQRKEATAGPTHPDLSVTLNGLGTVNAEMGRYGEAVDHYRRALKILESSAPDFAPNIARILHELSVTYKRSGQKEEAQATLEQSAALARANLEKAPDMATIVDDYAALLKNQGKTKEADELRRQAKQARTVSGLVIRAQSLF